MFKDKKVIIFDMDGTLIDSVGIWNSIDEELIKKIADGTIDDVNIQNQRDSILRKFSKSKDMYLEYCDFLRQKYNSKLNMEEIFKLRYEIAQNYINNVVEYKSGADKVLHKLKELEFVLVIATTTNKSCINAYKNINQNIISKANLEDIFSVILTKEDVKERKPNPEVYYKILNMLDVLPKDCLVIEDSLIGVEAAKNANIEVATIYDKYSDIDREEINKLANYNFKSFKEMLDYIEKEFN